MTARPTIIAEVLHLVEDSTHEPVGELGSTIKDIIAATEKSETTIRKAVKELLDGGFITDISSPDDRTARFTAVRKQDLIDDSRGGEHMADTETKQKSGGRGRPRDTAVQERDAKVLAFIGKTKEGSTVDEVAAGVGIDRNAAYLSIWRLRTAGTIVKVPSGARAPRWIKAA